MLAGTGLDWGAVAGFCCIAARIFHNPFNSDLSSDESTEEVLLELLDCRLCKSLILLVIEMEADEAAAGGGG